MTKPCIEYKSGYKYQLFKTYRVQISIEPDVPIEKGYLALDQTGLLVIKEGYAWDGPSGIAIDTRNFMRGSLVHDALYQLIRQGKLSFEDHRKQADDELKRLCLEDGMSSLRAWWVHLGVRKCGKAAARGDARKKVYGAPSQDCVVTDTMRPA